MATTDHEDIIYAKDNVCGTIYFTIDSQNSIAINFFHGINVKIILGVIRPICQLKGLFPETKHALCIHEPQKTAVSTSDRNDTSENRSSNHIAFMDVSSDVKEEGDEIQEAEIGEECNESADEDKEISVFPVVVLALPSTNASMGKNVELVHQGSNWERRTTITPEHHNICSSNSGNSRCSDKRKAHRSLRRKKEKVHDPLKVETGANPDKKGSSIQKKAVKGIKISAFKQSITLKARNNRKTLADSKPKIKSDQSKVKHSAKRKLARQISCQYCLKEFENQQAYYDHTKVSRSEVFKCSLCTKVFPFQAHLQAHISAYHQQEKLFTNLKESASCICDVCGAEVKNLFALKKHLMFHTHEYSYSCCICGKQFVEPGTLNNHMKTHKSGGMIRCKCCDQLFATRGALAKHKLASVEVKCHLCEQVFPNRTSRTQHYKVFHQNDILKCSKCASMFSSPEELAVHMKKHNLYKKKQCKICGKFFSRLEKHIVTHKAKTEIDESELFVCDKCPKKFTNRSSFQRHLTIHSQDKPYQCPNCPRKFADCGALRKHLRRHLSLMPFVCEVCGKKCKEPGNLKVHMRIHSDTKHFQCPECPQAFNYKSSLEGHMRSRHSQNVSSASLLPPVPGMKQDYDRVESAPHQVYRSTRIDPGPSQVGENGSWKLQLNSSQTFAPNIEMKQYYENRGNVCMKSIYEGNSVNPVALMARNTFQAHSMTVNPLSLDVSSKQTYIEDSPNVSNENQSYAYTRGANSVINGQAQEESSLSVTSLDVTTTMNVSSMNISLY